MMLKHIKKYKKYIQKNYAKNAYFFCKKREKYVEIYVQNLNNLVSWRRK